jgi:hypothetical protein
MPSAVRALAPLRIIALRAVVGYPMLRALLFVISALASAFAGQPVIEDFESPLGVVLIAAALGVVDIRRRGEAMLWGNLGFSQWTIAAIFAAAATLGEIVLRALIATLR